MRLIASLTAVVALMLPQLSIAAATPEGPAWWRISNGGASTLWVLGIPDGLMMDVKWNDASLTKRLSSAQRLLSPELGETASQVNPMLLGTMAD